MTLIIYHSGKQCNRSAAGTSWICFFFQFGVKTSLVVFFATRCHQVHGGTDEWSPDFLQTLGFSRQSWQNVKQKCFQTRLKDPQSMLCLLLILYGFLEPLSKQQVKKTSNLLFKSASLMEKAPLRGGRSYRKIQYSDFKIGTTVDGDEYLALKVLTWKQNTNFVCFKNLDWIFSLGFWQNRKESKGNYLVPQWRRKKIWYGWFVQRVFTI